MIIENANKAFLGKKRLLWNNGKCAGTVLVMHTVFFASFIHTHHLELIIAEESKNMKSRNEAENFFHPIKRGVTGFHNFILMQLYKMEILYN